MRILVLGGTRSGKSAYAERLVADADRVRYLATGPSPDDSDAAWGERVREHRNRRGARFETVETADPAAELRRDPAATVLLDDLGTWLTAVLDTEGWDRAGSASDTAAAGSPQQTDSPVVRRVADLVAAIADHEGDVVIVSPEVGLSVVSATSSGRVFTDEIGAANSAVAAVCDAVRLVVAGRVLDLPDDPTRTYAANGPGRVLPAVPLPVDAATETASPASAPVDEKAESPGVQAPATPTAAASTAVSAAFADVTAPDGRDAEVFAAVDPPSAQFADEARARHRTLTKPAGSLGLLEDLSVWVSACQGVCPPRPIAAPVVAVFAGDHGVARGGVSAYPPEVTAQMVANISSGGAAINVLARRLGATVHVFDLAVDADLPDGHTAVTAYKVRAGSGDLRTGDALTIAETRRAVAAGRDIADRLVDSGADLLVAGDMGIGNTTPAAVLVGTIADREPVVVVGRGTGIDDETWIRKTAAIRDGMRHGRRFRNEPLALLAAVGGADLAAMAGFYAQAAVRRTPVLLDGVVTTAAALVAEQMAPGASEWWRAGHLSTEPAHGLALDKLGLAPIVDLSMRLGEGTGALAALPSVMQGVDVLIDMATFADAGVSVSDAG